MTATGGSSLLPENVSAKLRDVKNILTSVWLEYPEATVRRNHVGNLLVYTHTDGTEQLVGFIDLMDPGFTEWREPGNG